MALGHPPSRTLHDEVAVRRQIPTYAALMNTRRFLSFARLVVVAVCALLGHSLTTALKQDFAQSIQAAIGGATIGIAALWLSAIVLPTFSREFSRASPTQILGLKIGMFGLPIATAGWIVNIYLSRQAGYWIAVFGIAVGFVGMVVLLVHMVQGRD